MNKKDEALKMVINLLDNEVDDPRCSDSIDKTIQVCKKALEEKKFIGLSFDEVDEIIDKVTKEGWLPYDKVFYVAIEQKLKEKNS